MPIIVRALNLSPLGANPNSAPAASECQVSNKNQNRGQT